MLIVATRIYLFLRANGASADYINPPAIWAGSCLFPYPTVPPLLWIEILSQDDAMVEVWARANELIALGVPYVWIIDPNTLESELPHRRRRRRRLASCYNSLLHG